MLSRAFHAGISAILVAPLLIISVYASDKPPGGDPEVDRDIPSDCVTDATPIIQRILSERGHVHLGKPVECYALASPLKLQSGMRVTAVSPEVTLRATGSTGQLIDIRSANSIYIGPMNFDGQNRMRGHLAHTPTIEIVDSTNVTIDHPNIVNPTNGIRVTNSRDVRVFAPRVVGSLAQGVEIDSTENYYVGGDGCFFQDNVFFGVIIRNGSSNGTVEGCRVPRNGVEAVGLTQDTHDNVIRQNEAHSTGDNCFSVSGFRNQLLNNIGTDCAGNGIGVYGGQNIIKGGFFKNNARLHAAFSGWAAGISIVPEFGGTGQDNAISDVHCDDDQQIATQKFCVKIFPTTYRPWSPNAAKKMGDFVYANRAIYRAASSGETGPTAPLHVSGSQSDGGVVWTFIWQLSDQAPIASRNKIQIGSISRPDVTPVSDMSGGHDNVLRVDPPK